MPAYRGPDEVEGGGIDFVIDAFVGDERLVAEQHEASVEVDVFVADRTLRRRGQIEFGEILLAFALERAGEADVDATALRTLHVDAEREVELGALDPLQGCLVDHRLRVVAATPTAGDQG